MLHDLSRPKPRNPITRSSATHLHAPQLFLECPHASSKISRHSQIIATRDAMSTSLLGDLQNPRSPVVYRVHTRQHAPPTFQDPSHTPPRFPHLQLIHWPHTLSYWPCRPLICLRKKYGFQPMLHVPPHATQISDFSSTCR